MTPPSRSRPGGGFLLLLLVLIGSASFFAWGVVTPPLEEVWRMQVELELGEKGPLSRRERELMQNALVRHPEIADSMLEGLPVGLISAAEEGRVELDYAYLVRRQAEPPMELVVTRSGVPSDAAPIEVSARVEGTSQKGTAAPGSPFRWTLPQNGPFPQLIEVRLKGGRSRGEVTVEARKSP